MAISKIVLDGKEHHRRRWGQLTMRNCLVASIVALGGGARLFVRVCSPQTSDAEPLWPLAPWGPIPLTLPTRGAPTRRT